MKDDVYKEKIAMNKNTSISILEKLIFDKSKYVRWNIMRNQNVTAYMITVLIFDEDIAIRCRALEHEKLPEYIVEKIALDEDCWWSYYAIKNPNISNKTLLQLVTHKHKPTSQAAIARIAKRKLARTWKT